VGKNVWCQNRPGLIGTRAIFNLFRNC